MTTVNLSPMSESAAHLRSKGACSCAPARSVAIASPPTAKRIIALRCIEIPVLSVVPSYRRMLPASRGGQARMDKPKAVTAAAHRLERLIYVMLTKGQWYTDQGRTGVSALSDREFAKPPPPEPGSRP